MSTREGNVFLRGLGIESIARMIEILVEGHVLTRASVPKRGCLSSSLGRYFRAIPKSVERHLKVPATLGAFIDEAA